MKKHILVHTIIKKSVTCATSIIFFMFLAPNIFADIAGLLNPKGTIAIQQRILMLDTLALMLIVVIPVIIMSFVFAYRFRVKRRLGEYKPDWHDNPLLETFWWGIPTLIIFILSIITWTQTHKLDPYHEIGVGTDKQVVEVVALRWKWLFIYPEENIATINDLHIKKNAQVEFHITADAPMSAFSIPQLGGQIYAMAGMRTRLHLHSDIEGVYQGLNTQLNGEGFSDMHFPSHVVSKEKFTEWVNWIKAKNNPLTIEKYKYLYNPTTASPSIYYSETPKNLFMNIMMQYTTKDHWLH